ncbi:MAG: hypothetical protein PVI51_05320 [candidate division WOR-3 bacterium]|jgi:hypothetical protein
MTISCVKEYPPFDEYQVAGYAPIDTVLYGSLFVAGDRLYVLYDTLYYNQWSLIREYDISDPLAPELISVEEMTLPLWTYYVSHQDTLVFFQQYYTGLTIFNLSSRVSYDLVFDFGINDIAYAQDYLFVSAYDGLHVLDISALPNYVEVFHDTAGYAPAFNVLRDTVLLEIYNVYGYQYKFWNVTNPEQPEGILEGDLPNQPYNIAYIGLTEQYLVCSYYSNIRVYHYDLDDSLVYEDAMHLDFTPDILVVSDSLVYVADHDHIEIIRIGDLSTVQIGLGDSYTEGILSIDVLDGRIYVLIRNRGIQVYERREP